MTNVQQSARFQDEIAWLRAEEGREPSDAFAAAFQEQTDSFQIDREDEISTAPMPDAWEAERAAEMMVTTMFDLLRDTRLEGIAARIAWGVVHSFHKVAEGLDREADQAAVNVKSLIRDADGSEVATRDLEEAIRFCKSLDEAREAVACLRAHSSQCYLAETGRPWSAPKGSQVSSKSTASVVAGRDFLAARRQRRLDAHNPQGPIVLFSGGQLWEDHGLITRTLDAIKRRIPQMVLATTAQGKGCDAIAASWAARNGVPLVAFTLEALKKKYGERAAFLRNQQMLGVRPVEAVICQGSGIQSNLARMVRERGVPAHLFRIEDQGRDGA
ncbi:MAG TPA: DUF2493 domain-containing protein [Sphingobium sp.]|uniref:DUF2493 domain-containing protein n=1 Tax=Sphingobium sp. TaxID=1912891 RepID=UPI002ED1D2B2